MGWAADNSRQYAWSRPAADASVMLSHARSVAKARLTIDVIDNCLKGRARGGDCGLKTVTQIVGRNARRIWGPARGRNNDGITRVVGLLSSCVVLRAKQE